MYIQELQTCKYCTYWYICIYYGRNYLGTSNFSNQREIELAGSSFQAFFKRQMQLLVHVQPFHHVQPHTQNSHLQFIFISKYRFRILWIHMSSWYSHYIPIYRWFPTIYSQYILLTSSIPYVSWLYSYLQIISHEVLIYS